jgi:asparagine N-glycosylation enzyme membrane subunit Stt3
MNKWKGLSILFGIISFGAIQETFRILTSSDTDIATNRLSLIPMAVIITGLLIFLTIRFWRKSSKQRGL